MKKRNARIIINKSGGSSSENSYTYRVTLPNSWVNEMGLRKDNRELELLFDGQVIKIRPRQSLTDYVNSHRTDELYEIRFYKDDMLCTTIIANYTEKDIKIDNESVDIIYLAFGNNLTPDWNDYLDFLRERCIPQQRDGIKEYLSAIGVAEYDPFQIIQKTNGIMAEDHHRLEVKRL